MDYVSYFAKRNLLTDGKSNTKTAKNTLPTYYLSLQPVNLNDKGENLCKFSTKECRNMCLQFSGRQSFSNVVMSRQNKTNFYVLHKPLFLTKLYNELELLNGKCSKDGSKVAVRLNLLSDVDWEFQLRTYTGKSLGDLKQIQFYDYTKDHTKILNNQLSNYHFTYSFSGHNWNNAELFLKHKLANVAVVFKKVVPSKWRNLPVIVGDNTDERFLDPRGVIVGLKYKTPKGVIYSKNKFVVDDQG